MKIFVDKRVRRGPWMLGETCRRMNGSLRAWFSARDEAERFAADPANIQYHGDVAHLCGRCGRWHLSKIEWLVNAPMPETVN